MGLKANVTYQPSLGEDPRFDPCLVRAFHFGIVLPTCKLLSRINTGHPNVCSWQKLEASPDQVKSPSSDIPPDCHSIELETYAKFLITNGHSDKCITSDYLAFACKGYLQACSYKSHIAFSTMPPESEQ